MYSESSLTHETGTNNLFFNNFQGSKQLLSLYFQTKLFMNSFYFSLLYTSKYQQMKLFNSFNSFLIIVISLLQIKVGTKLKLHSIIELSCAHFHSIQIILLKQNMCRILKVN